MPCFDCNDEDPDWVLVGVDWRVDDDLITPFSPQRTEKEVRDTGPFAPEAPAISPDDVEG